MSSYCSPLSYILGVVRLFNICQSDDVSQCGFNLHSLVTGWSETNGRHSPKISDPNPWNLVLLLDLVVFADVIS